jgi:hypothetical protein
MPGEQGQDLSMRRVQEGRSEVAPRFDWLGHGHTSSYPGAQAVGKRF